MEISSHEGEIPMPLNSAYGGHGHGHLIHHDHHNPTPHNHILPSSTPQIPSNNGPSSLTLDHDHHNHVSTTTTTPPSSNFKKMIKYRECLKNHAASMGGNATDGCGEFMPSGEEGSIEALTCSACNCHRNFHRKEIEGEISNCECYPPTAAHFNRRKLLLGHHKNILGPETLGYPTGTGTLVSSRAATTAIPHHNQMIMSYNLGGSGSLPSESDEQEEIVGGVVMAARPQQQLMKKRFRTKFTQDQKDKMLNFAEKVGWKIQKQEESVVQQFCQEIGVKRRVLKVWMHNNKHNLAKTNPLFPITVTTNAATTPTTTS